MATLRFASWRSINVGQYVATYEVRVAIGLSLLAINERNSDLIALLV